MRKAAVAALVLATSFSLTACGFNFSIGPKGIVYETYGNGEDTKNTEGEAEGTEDTEETEEIKAAESKKTKSAKSKETDAEDAKPRSNFAEDAEEDTKSTRDKSRDIKTIDVAPSTEIGVGEMSLKFPALMSIVQNSTSNSIVEQNTWGNGTTPNDSDILVIAGSMKLSGLQPDAAFRTLLEMEKETLPVLANGTDGTEWDAEGKKWTTYNVRETDNSGTMLAGFMGTDHNDKLYYTFWITYEGDGYDNAEQLILDNVTFGDTSISRESTNTETTTPKPSTGNTTNIIDRANNLSGLSYNYPDYLEASTSGSMYFYMTGLTVQNYKYDSQGGRSENLGIGFVTKELFNRSEYDKYDNVSDVVDYYNNLYSTILKDGARHEIFTDDNGNEWHFWNAYTTYDTAAAVGDLNGEAVVIEWQVMTGGTEPSHESRMLSVINDMIKTMVVE